MYLHGRGARPRKGVELYGDVGKQQGMGGEGGNNSFVSGIRKAEEEDAEDEEREGASELESELTNAKELSGISHLISRATRLRDSLVRESARKSAEA